MLKKMQMWKKKVSKWDAFKKRGNSNNNISSSLLFITSTNKVWIFIPDAYHIFQLNITNPVPYAFFRLLEMKILQKSNNLDFPYYTSRVTW